jgi:hypothetical protein
VREGIQGPLANCSLFSQTVFLARWTVGARRSASPPSAGRGTGCRPEQVAARHTFGPDCVSRAGRNAFVRRMCIGRGPRRRSGSALGAHWGRVGGALGPRWGRTGAASEAHWGRVGGALGPRRRRPRPNLRVNSSAQRRTVPSTCGSSRQTQLTTSTKPQVSLEGAAGVAGGGTRGGRRPARGGDEFSRPRRTSHHAKPRRRDAAGARVLRSSRQYYCC